MNGHVHLGISHFGPIALAVLIAMALWRILAIVATNSDLPLVKTAGKALAFIVS